MGSRWILYGYKMEDDVYSVVPKEAETVIKAFELYINGMSLKMVADSFTSERIPYSEEKSIWNKNMISRIIENRHYLGDDKYPPIVEESTYEEAALKRNHIGGKRKKDTREIKYLKSILYCSSCYERIRRVSKYTNREKWVCDNRCKVAVFMDDATLISKVVGIINRIIEDTSLLEIQMYRPTFELEIEATKKTNEFRYMIDQSNMRFETAKMALIDCIESRFEFCKFNPTVYTKPLQEYMKKQEKINYINVDLMKSVCERIYINSDGSITICFINGKEVNSAERIVNRNENTGGENNNKD